MANPAASSRAENRNSSRVEKEANSSVECHSRVEWAEPVMDEWSRSLSWRNSEKERLSVPYFSRFLRVPDVISSSSNSSRNRSSSMVVCWSGVESGSACDLIDSMEASTRAMSESSDSPSSTGSERMVSAWTAYRRARVRCPIWSDAMAATRRRRTLTVPMRAASSSPAWEDDGPDSERRDLVSDPVRCE